MPAFYISLRHSNTTLVKVKLKNNISNPSIALKIQIQHLLKLNIAAQCIAQHRELDSNTTLVKVKSIVPNEILQSKDYSNTTLVKVK